MNIYNLAGRAMRMQDRGINQSILREVNIAMTRGLISRVQGSAILSCWGILLGELLADRLSRTELEWMQVGLAVNLEDILQIKIRHRIPLPEAANE
jgi:hypothetical protein